MTLVELAPQFPNTDKGTAHSYLEVYDGLFGPVRESVRSVLEVGVSWGDSLKMWDAYFPNAKVYGCDIGTAYLDDRVKVLDATDRNAVGAAYGGQQFDIIIEDASHRIWDQVATYANLKDHVAPGGIYVIEDIADLDTEPRINGTPNRETYLNIDPAKRVTLIDRRAIKNRWDDVLLVIRDP